MRAYIKCKLNMYNFWFTRCDAVLYIHYLYLLTEVGNLNVFLALQSLGKRDFELSNPP